jgi:hypothetical protein
MGDAVDRPNGSQTGKAVVVPLPEGRSAPTEASAKDGGLPVGLCRAPNPTGCGEFASGSGFDGYPRAPPRLYTSSHVKITTAETITAANPSLRLPSR